MNWYYAANGQQIGPIAEEAFQELVAKGEIQSTTLVWNGGMTGWKPDQTRKLSVAVPAVKFDDPSQLPFA